MNPLDMLAAIGKAKSAIDDAEKIRRDRTTQALVDLCNDTLTEGGVKERARAVTEHLDAVLAASSQASAVREIAKAFGVGDLLRSVIDRLESGK